MYQPHEYRQEIARQHHADMLRAVRRERLAAALEAERESAPHRRLARLTARALALVSRPRVAAARRLAGST